jgi:hypothetical protein
MATTKYVVVSKPLAKLVLTYSITEILFKNGFDFYIVEGSTGKGYIVVRDAVKTDPKEIIFDNMPAGFIVSRSIAR